VTVEEGMEDPTAQMAAAARAVVVKVEAVTEVAVMAVVLEVEKAGAEMVAGDREGAAEVAEEAQE
jgi:hypothetical protein